MERKVNNNNNKDGNNKNNNNNNDSEENKIIDRYLIFQWKIVVNGETCIANK